MNEELKIIISAEVAKVKQGVKQAKDEIKQFSQKVKEAKKNVDASFKAMGESIKTTVKAIGATIAGLGAALLGVAASTEEYRNQQAQLQTAFQTAGASAADATATYNALYRVLGDGGQAQEAAQHLAMLTTNSEHLAEWGNICQGVYASFGASLPIEGLTEAVNHTAKLGEVQGALADALEWSGVNVDDFNTLLAECSTEAEREALIRETLNGLYSEAAANYETNNAAILAQRDAQAKLQEKLAAIGAAIAPVITAFTSFAGDALALVTPYITGLAEKAIPKLTEMLNGIIPALETAAAWVKEHSTLLTAIAVVIGTVVAAITLYNTVAAIKAAMAAAEVATVAGLATAYLAQAAAVMAALAPYLLIIAAVALLVAGFLYLWNNCEGFREFWLNLWEQLKAVFAAFVESLKPIWGSIVNLFKQALETIKAVWNFAKPFFQGIWNAIKAIFSAVVEVLGGVFKAAWNIIKSVWNTAASFFKAVIDTIAAIFSVVTGILSGNFENAWTQIKKVFSSWGSFFGNLWNTVKTIFSNVAQAIGGAIKGTVSGAVNAVLSTAAGIINGFISAINVAIGVINAIPGVSIGYLNKLNVPQMAKGGVVDSATLAVVGEAGKEAVVPLENNLEWLDKLAGMLNDRMGGNQPIVLNVDGKRFAEISVDSINNLTRQRGSIPLVIA